MIENRWIKDQKPDHVIPIDLAIEMLPKHEYRGSKWKLHKFAKNYVIIFQVLRMSWDR